MKFFLFTALLILTACKESGGADLRPSRTTPIDPAVFAAGTYKPRLSADGVTGDPEYFVNPQIGGVNTGVMPVECNGIGGLGETFTVDGMGGISNRFLDLTYTMDDQDNVRFSPSGITFKIDSTHSPLIYLTFAEGCVAEYEWSAP
jgi:hypothetical protein